MKSLIVSMFFVVTFSTFGQTINKKNCEIKKDFCFENWILKWRTGYTRDLFVMDTMYPDQFDEKIDIELLEMLASHFNLNIEFDKTAWKKITGRFEEYDVKKHFNENQNVKFIAPDEKESFKNIWLEIECVYFNGYFILVQYSYGNSQSIEFLEFNDHLRGYKSLGSVRKYKEFYIDGSYEIKYTYREG